MEPGHEDRENQAQRDATAALKEPQWSPVTRTGKTMEGASVMILLDSPQWSPVTRTGKTTYISGKPSQRARPQWSPVTRTGKTRPHQQWPHQQPSRNGARSRGPGKRVHRDRRGPGQVAAMEPGHEDRENALARAVNLRRLVAAMEPGHEDRENRSHKW